jgi:hypothetical protein
VLDIEGLARTWGAAAASGQAQKAERAVQLWAAAHALRESLGMPLAPLYRELNERALADLRRSVAPERFALRWAEGHALSLEQVIAGVQGTESNGHLDD